MIKCRERISDVNEVQVLRIDKLWQLFLQPFGQARAQGGRKPLRVLRFNILWQLQLQPLREASPWAGQQVHLVWLEFDWKLQLQPVGAA